MAELIGALNGAANSNRDAHLAAAGSVVVLQGVVSGLTVTSTTVSAGMALVSVTRTSVSPSETFLVPFYLTATKAITTGASKKIWVRIDSAQVNDPALITDANGANVGVVEVGTSWPSGNYVKLAETDGAGTVVTTNRENVGLSGLKRKGLTPYRVYCTDVNGDEQEITLGSSGTALISNGPATPPTFQAPNVPRITGEIIAWPTPFPPTDWLICDGASVSRTTYASLFAKLNYLISNVTVTIASPAVFTTTNSQNIVNWNPVYLSTTGSLPTGFTPDTTYYVVNSSGSTFQLSATIGGAAINSSGTQSGTHSVNATPWGVASSTTFNVPNLKGRVVVGRDSAQGEFDILGETGGEKAHTLTIAEMPAHSHNISIAAGGSGSWLIQLGQNTSAGSPQATSSVGSSTPFNLLQPYAVMHYIIKT